jgi:hypothetical protein
MLLPPRVGKFVVNAPAEIGGESASRRHTMDLAYITLSEPGAGFFLVPKVNDNFALGRPDHLGVLGPQ